MLKSPQDPWPAEAELRSESPGGDGRLRPRLRSQSPSGHHRAGVAPLSRSFAPVARLRPASRRGGLPGRGLGGAGPTVDERTGGAQARQIEAVVHGPFGAEIDARGDRHRRDGDRGRRAPRLGGRRASSPCATHLARASDARRATVAPASVGPVLVVVAVCTALIELRGMAHEPHALRGRVVRARRVAAHGAGPRHRRPRPRRASVAAGAARRLRLPGRPTVAVARVARARVASLRHVRPSAVAGSAIRGEVAGARSRRSSSRPSPRPARPPAPMTADDPRRTSLVLAADSLRADRLDPRTAPHLSALADRGTRFDRAYVSLPRTFPSWVTPPHGPPPAPPRHPLDVPALGGARARLRRAARSASRARGTRRAS